MNTAGLRAEDVGVERLDQVVDRAVRVAAEDVDSVAVHRGDEDDRDVAAARVLLDEAGGLEAVHVRHLHVQQDEGELAVKDLAQRLDARSGHDQLVAQRRQDRFQRHQVGRVIVDDQNAGARLDRRRVGIGALRIDDPRASSSPSLKRNALAVPGPQPDQVQQLPGVDRLGQ
jgi:hypothetical protein